MKKWNEEFFNLRYQELFMNRDSDTLKEQALLLKNVLNLTAGKSVADFCCGVGDLLAELEKDHIVGYGIEYCADYVKTARLRYAQEKVYEGDAINFKLNILCDAVYCWYSSFGYFDIKTNEQLLDNMIFHLKKGGVCAIEIYNAYDVLSHYQPVLHYSKNYQGKEITINRYSSIDITHRILHQKWIFNTDGNLETFDTNVRLYFTDEIKALMESRMLSNIEILEYSPNGGLLPASMSSKRIIVRGIK